MVSPYQTICGCGLATWTWTICSKTFRLGCFFLISPAPWIHRRILSNEQPIYFWCLSGSQNTLNAQMRNKVEAKAINKYIISLRVAWCDISICANANAPCSCSAKREKMNRSIAAIYAVFGERTRFEWLVLTRDEFDYELCNTFDCL